MYKYFFLLLISFTTAGQFLLDADAKGQAVRGLDFLYNNQWSAGRKELEKIYTKYEEHPVSFLLKATYLYLKFAPIENYPQEERQYVAYLNECVASGESLLKTYPEESTFYLLAAHGYLAQIHHYKKDYLKAALEGKKAYAYFKKGKELKGRIPDFLFTSGMYNYYRVQYPISHPSIKTVISFFEAGNKELGIKELQQAIAKSTFSRIEAANYLGGIYLKYEDKPSLALEVYTRLSNKYPNNAIFRMRKVESLIALDKADLAKKEMERISGNKNVLVLAEWLFKGMLEKDKKVALANFARALQVEAKGAYVQDYRSMAYLFLAEGFYEEGKLDKARLFLRKAQENANYLWVLSRISQLKERLS